MFIGIPTSSALTAQGRSVSYSPNHACTMRLLAGAAEPCRQSATTPTPSIHCTRGFAAWCALREGTVYHVPEVPHCTPTVRPTLSFHGHTASHISTGGGGRRVTTAVCGTSSSTKSFTEAPGRVHTGVRKLISCSSRCPWSSQSCQRCP